MATNEPRAAKSTEHVLSDPAYTATNVSLAVSGLRSLRHLAIGGLRVWATTLVTAQAIQVLYFSSNKSLIFNQLIHCAS
jgi:hypothetical protein